MQLVELLTVENCFEIARHGILVHPDFSVPKGKFKDHTICVVIVRPDGLEFQASAQLHIVHFNLTDPNASIDARYRLILSFPTLKKFELPAGSKIMVSPETRDIVLHGNVI